MSTEISMQLRTCGRETEYREGKWNKREQEREKEGEGCVIISKKRNEEKV